MDLKFVVTGTGRCGTVFMARLLTSLGIPCSHEGTFTNSGLKISNDIRTSEVSQRKNGQPLKDDWLKSKPIADSSYMAAPFLKMLRCKTIHVVRNPIDVLNSFYKKVGMFSENCPAEQFPYREFIRKNLPKIDSISDEISKTAYYIVRWNRLIEKSNPSWFHRVEDKISDDFLQFLETPRNNKMFEDCTVNNWSHLPDKNNSIDLKDIPEVTVKQDFQKLMEDYKYE